jgi:hypothetical protein
VLAFAANAAPVNIPANVKMPELTPLVSPCADPAADRFIEVDISQRPPAGAERVQRISAWVTPDGVLHWPFVMRVRNIGDQPFYGKPGKQSALITEDDVLAKTKGKVVGKATFDQIGAHSGVAVRFMFEAKAADVEKGKFHRIYTLSIKYDQLDQSITEGKTGDCDLRNNTFFIELDGSRKGWIFGK